MSVSFPRIETTRLELRPFTSEDVDALLQLWIDPGVRKFLWDDSIITRETAIAVVESSLDGFVNHGFGFWTIQLKNDPKLIGFVGLRHFNEDGVEEREVEIVYGVAPAHWGGGIATEAARAVLRYGFEELSLDEIHAGADPPNAASFRVIEKLGMSFDRKLVINALEAIYYVMRRNDYKLHFELDSKIALK